MSLDLHLRAKFQGRLCYPQSLLTLSLNTLSSTLSGDLYIYCFKSAHCSCKQRHILYKNRALPSLRGNNYIYVQAFLYLPYFFPGRCYNLCLDLVDSYLAMGLSAYSRYDIIFSKLSFQPSFSLSLILLRIRYFQTDRGSTCKL